MVDPVLPAHLVAARQTPRFDADSVPAALRKDHHTAVWAELVVEAGTVRFVEAGGSARDLRVEAGHRLVIVPDVKHQVEPSADAAFYVQFYKEPDA